MRTILLLSAVFLSGCYSLQISSDYQGPPRREAWIEEYYPKGASYSAFHEETVEEREKYTLKQITILTSAGEAQIDFFQRQEKSDNLILVFPVLGGKKNLIENYFADYFARHGYDTAIVNRSNDFKDPDNFDRLEELFRENVIRDRIALDFFEKQYGKKNFGTFGISRGAINVAISAGVDPRFKYNVLAMGGSDIVAMFKHSNQRRLKEYREQIMLERGITEEQFYQVLNDRIKTDPKYLARFMDARNTLLLLGVFDQTVPYKYGRKLWREIGYPRAVFLVGTHYTSILYTQFVKLMLPEEDICLFPVDFVETQAMDFYDESFKQDNFSWRWLPLKILRIPIDTVAEVVESLF